MAVSDVGREEVLQSPREQVGEQRREKVRDAAACGALGCDVSGPLYRVFHPEKGERVLCDEHAALLVVS